MKDREAVAETGKSVAAASFVATVIIAVLVALFIWQPWSTAPRPPAGATRALTSP